MKCKKNWLIWMILMLGITGMTTGCYAYTKTKTETYVLKDGDILTKMTFTAKGDKVIAQTTETNLPYSAIGVSSKEEAKEMFDVMVKEFQGKEGISESIKYEEDRLTEKLKIDYEKADLEEVADLPGSQFDESARKNGVSLKKTVKMLEEKGAVKEK